MSRKGTLQLIYSAAKHNQSSQLVKKCRNLLSTFRRDYAVPAEAATTHTDDGILHEQIEAKPFSEVPGPKGWPVIGNLLTLPKMIRAKNQHEVLLENFEKYGPIWKEKMGAMEIVNLSDVAAVEKLHRLEGKYPRRITLEPWRHWREEQKHSKGVLIE